MNVVRWRPFREFDSLLNDFERRAIERRSAPLRRADWLPLVDIGETEASYVIEVEVPAVASEDLSVTVAENVLTVSGERKAREHAEQDGKVHRVERRFGRFVRNFRLPEDADQDAIQAQARDGVLYLTIAKRPSAVAKSIEVQVS